jgi:hypothetical protein
MIGMNGTQIQKWSIESIYFFRLELLKFKANFKICDQVEIVARLAFEPKITFLAKVQKISLNVRSGMLCKRKK